MVRDHKTDRDGIACVVRCDGPPQNVACTPSESIIRYFFDVLSPREAQQITDHLADCDLCSAKLLAIEISAEISMATTRSRTDLAIAGQQRDLAGVEQRQKQARHRMDRRRSRRLAALNVVALDDRELMTTMGLGLNIESRIQSADIRRFATAVAIPTVEPKKSLAGSGVGGGVPDASVWDHAIDDLFGAVEFRFGFGRCAA
jgi:hypothetical protein